MMCTTTISNFSLQSCTLTFTSSSYRILGLDLGSTSLRAYLYDPATGASFFVENKDSDRKQCRYQPGDFSTKGYPFDTDSCSGPAPIYLGEATCPGRVSTSLKFSFYALADAGDDKFKDYHVVKPILERKHDKAFRDNLMKGMRALFRKVQDRVAQVCSAKRLRVTRVAITVPVQWSVEMYRLYSILVQQTFKMAKYSVFCISETEAAAHYLFK